MSKQLSIAAAFSVFAMAAFALSSTADRHDVQHAMGTGAKAHASAPAFGQAIPAISLVAD